MDAVTIPLHRQLAAVRNEIALRRRVYPRFIASGRLTESEAADRIDCMVAVLDTPRRAGGARAESVSANVRTAMHQDRCVELAREAAVACGERHSYMPATDLLAETWQPHRWVIDAMLLAADEAERERDQYRAGNTELLEALMRYAEGQESAPAFAQDVLGRAGMLNGADGTLNWQALEDRKPKPITWEQAVNECVTDPEERARLLALARAKAAAEAAKPEVEREAALLRW